MGIQTSLYSGISGLNTHGAAMTVIGNNIANTNTVGFKTSRTIFSDLLSSAVSGSGGDAQVGRGVGLSTVDNSFSQGTFESTESNTDLAIEGSGFFMVRDPLSTELNYTRAGAFRFNESGYLTNAEGYRVQGYALDANGNTVGDLTDIQVATNTQGYSQANATATVTLSTNLDSKVAIVESFVTGTGVIQANTAATLTDPTGVLEVDGAPVTIAGVGTDQQGSAKNIAAGLTSISGITATVSATSFDLGIITNIAVDAPLAAGNLVINGTNITGAITAADTKGTLATAITAAAIPGLNVDSSGTGIILSMSDGSNIQITADGAGDANFVDATITNLSLDSGGAQTAFGGVSISGTSIFEITAGITAATHGVTITSDSTGGLGFDINNPTTTSSYAASLRVYDSLGDTHLITNYFTKTAANTWDVNTVVSGAEIGSADALVKVGNTTLTFNTTGTLASSGTLTTTASALTWANAAAQDQQLTFTLSTTQYASDSVVNSQAQDGYAAGTLVAIDIDASGDIYGKYSNGEPRALARITLASFGNPSGLLKKGNNLYSQTTSSGASVVGTVGSGVGKLFTNSLEQSNVDLAQEFVKMITIQRGFQANSKIITTTDEMMADLINLKR